VKIILVGMETTDLMGLVESTQELVNLPLLPGILMKESLERILKTVSSDFGESFNTC